MNENWYIVFNNQQIGPMSAEQMKSYHVTPDTLVWRNGETEWRPIYSYPELMQALSTPGTSYPGPGPVGGPTVAPVAPAVGPCPPHSPMYGAQPVKDKTATGLFAIFLGGLGIQYFYLGKVTGGIITIVLSLITCGVWSILTLIQGILMLTMTQAEFERKYVYTQSDFPLF